ncbi:HrgA protein [Marinomonas sp. IMCC 4694]|uniref:HrgA protein n=1 Tax=Marinomonas sp. IMCC 4694 TaxID=2605432 RepID=UPI0011E78BD9|nr:HrgA protein [Marinomonas sp. IMCC 4694]TYL46647.1 HrgA protein [Marinomonas sp. IMCC 4694]
MGWLLVLQDALILNTESLYDSQILIPAKERSRVDWQSANRIVTENSDFHHYIEQVSIYNQTGRLTKSAWNKQPRP